MKLSSSFISAACAVLFVSGLAAQEAPFLPLDRRPTYQVLTAAGFKLLNPDPSYGNPLGATDYRVEPCRFALGLGEARSIPFELHGEAGVEFQKHELTPPGNQYPPILPVQDATPILILTFDCKYPDIAAARAALASVEKMLKVDMAKVDAWIQYQLWESAPVLKLTASVPDAESQVELLYRTGLQGQTGPLEPDCRLIFQFRWNAPPAPTPPPRRPIPHAGQQPAQPQPVR